MKDFYAELINLDLQNSKKTRRIIALENLYKLFYISRDLDNSLKQICYIDSNNNLLFNSKFFAVFEMYKKQAILKLIEHYYQRFNIDDFEIKFPQLKNKITRIIKSEKSRLFLTFGHTGDLSYGIGFEFLKYCSERLYNKNHSKLISNFNKITRKGTNKVKPHIVRRLSTLLSEFEFYKREQVNNLRKLIESLLESISYKNICLPFWIKNNSLLFYYYRTPHGIWEKDSSKYNSIKEKIIKKYNICQKIPIQSNLRFIPRLWFKKIDRHICFATLNNKTCHIFEEFFSMENLNKANEDDKEFLKYLSLK